MRALILRQAAVLAIVLVAVGLVLTSLSSGLEGATRQIGWALALSAGIAGFTAWQTAAKARRGFIASVNPGFQLESVARDAWPGVDWQALDDYSAQLEARGYRNLGDFTTNQPPTAARGMARFLADADGTRIVEIQHFERLAPTPLMGDEHFTVHVNVSSTIGGRIRVMATDRPVHPAFFLGRGASTVYASYPGKALLELIDLHRRLCDFVAERTGKALDAGYTLERYALLEREKQAEVKTRFERTGAWALLGEYDAFAANPQSQYSPAPAWLKALAPRDWKDLDASAQAPAIAPAVASAASAPAAPAAPAAAAGTPDRQQLHGSAQWFYWIAGLSLVNALSSAFGSQWGFIIGLGATQVVSAVVQAVAAQGGSSVVVAGIGWVINLALIGAFVLFGWIGQRPSVAAFTIGIGLFALDTLVFLLAGDWIGVAFHALALYFLSRGFSAARRIKRATAP